MDHPIADPCNTNPADPNYFNNHEFIIEPNIISNMTAGEVITLKDGFTAKEGCTFRASIDENMCTDGRMASGIRPTPYQETDQGLLAAMDSANQGSLASRATLAAQSVVADTEKIQSTSDAFDAQVFPNPGHGSFDITIHGTNLIGKITVYNFMGTVISQQMFNNSYQHLDISNNAKGVYYIKVESEEQFKMLKIIYE